MSLSGEAIRILALKGLSVEDIAEVADANRGPSVSDKKSAAALRQQRYRERKASQTITEHNARDAEDGVTNHNESVTDHNERDAPRARGLDKSLKVVDNNLTIPDLSASGRSLDRATMDRIEALVRQAAAPALNVTSPSLFDLSPLLGLLKQGQGPPCDLEADMLPAIRARSAAKAPGTVQNWSYFVPAIRQARDNRLTGAPAQAPANDRPDNPQQRPSHPRESRADGRQRAALAVLEERGAFE